MVLPDQVGFPELTGLPEHQEYLVLLEHLDQVLQEHQVLTDYLELMQLLVSCPVPTLKWRPREPQPPQLLKILQELQLPSR
jgi:hypothetical protein